MPKLKDFKFPRPVQAITVAPGVKLIPIDKDKIPSVGICDWINNGNGSYTPVIRVTDAWMRLSEVELLPFGMSAEVIMKLYQGGFVEGARPAPNNTTINVRSLIAHIEECSADPDYWADSERLNRFKNGLFGPMR